jgi:hypothetical protein
MTGKQQVESLLHKLPDSCSLEDIQYHLYVLERVRGKSSSRGLAKILDGSRVGTGETPVLHLSDGVSA